MQRIRYEHILQNLNQTLAFCESIGLGDIADRSRFADYRRCIERLIESLRMRPVPREIEEHQHEYRVALEESMQFGNLLPYFQQCDCTLVCRKLKDCLSGLSLPSDESPTSNQARNIQFELLLASTLQQAGFETVLGEHPDLKCKVDNTWFFFECKRPYSTETATLKKRIHEASKQL